MPTFPRTFLTLFALLACGARCDIDHTVAYLYYDSGNATFYTSVYYSGEYNSSGAAFTDTITLVGTQSHPERAGNSQTCALTESCTLTTPTTITITANPSTVRTYSLNSLGFTIPWQYYLSQEIDGGVAPTGPSCPTNTVLLRTVSQKSLAANTARFGNVSSFCMSQETYTLSPGPYSDHPGPPFPPITHNLWELADNPAFQESCDINSCPRTSQTISGVSSGYTVVSCCCASSDNVCSGGQAMYYLQAINPYTGPVDAPANSNVGVCNVYSISSPASLDSVTVNVTSSLGSEEIVYLVSDGDTVQIPVGDTVWELSVTGTGTSGSTAPVTDAYLLQDGALLIECTPYPGGRSNVSIPNLCNDVNNHEDDNFIFYVPSHYASNYNNNLGYGGSVYNILNHLSAYMNSVDICFDYGTLTQYIPGYPTAATYGVLYNGLVSLCGRQNTTVPLFDAEDLCYNSVSPSTMYDAQANGLDQWYLPGTFEDDVFYSVEWDDPDSGGVLTETIPSTAKHPVSSHTYQFSLRIDIAETLMDYVFPDLIPTATVDKTETNCGYIATGDTSGQYKVTVCNAGSGDNAQTFVNYAVSSYCQDGLNITGNTTLITDPLAQGDCQGIIYALVVLPSDFVPVPTVPNGTDPAGPATPPTCHTSILTTPTPAGLPAVTSSTSCIRLPPAPKNSFPYVAVGVSVGIFFLLFCVFLVWLKYGRAIKDPVKKKKKTD